MLPAQFIVLLILAALPAEIATAARTEKGIAPTPDGETVNLAILAYGNLVLMNLLLCVHVMFQARRTMRKLHQTTTATTDILAKIDEIFFRSRIFTIIMTGAILYSTPLTEVVFHWRDQTQLFRHIPLLAEMLFMAPAILAWIGIWAATYYLEEAGRQRAMPYRLARGLPVHEMPSLGSFLMMQMRHNFFPLIFLFIVTAMDKIASRASGAGTTIVSILSAAVMIIGVPIILTKVWSTTPLPGALRERLVAVAAMYRLRFRNILLWKTHHLTLNAAILGWFPGARYFLMSDVLLETNTDKQIEAVFAHEVGHGVHWHIPWYMATLGGALMLAAGIAQAATSLVPMLGTHEEIMSVVIMFGLTLVVGGFAIYTVAPRFEHQADWFACRHMARVMMESPAQETAAAVPVAQTLPDELEGALLMSPTTADQITMTQYIAGAYPHSTKREGSADTGSVATAAAPAYSGTVLEAGSEVFISALLSIVDKTQRAHDKRDLMHPSINDRVTFLRSLARDESAERAFSRRISRTRMAIVGLLLAGGTILALTSALLPTPAGAHAAVASSATTMPATAPNVAPE